MHHFLFLSWLLCVLGTASASEQPAPAFLRLRGVPPSPSRVSGERIPQQPQLGHWPALIYADELRHVSLQIPLQYSGQAGRLGWQGGPEQLLRLQAQEPARQLAALLALPRQAGLHQAQLQIAEQQWTLAIRVVRADTAAWPHDSLQDGFPLDEQGRPVVLLLERGRGHSRRWGLLRPRLPRPSGVDLLVGDPLQALGRGVFPEDRQQRLYDGPHPHHAALLALAQEPAPRSLLWSPGNGAIEAGSWNPEELRLLEAVNQRFLGLGVMPRRILLLPPLPRAAALRALSQERRQALRFHAAQEGWEVFDPQALLGGSHTALALAPGIYSRYPQGEHQELIRSAVRRILE